VRVQCSACCVLGDLQLVVVRRDQCAPHVLQLLLLLLLLLLRRRISVASLLRRAPHSRLGLCAAGHLRRLSEHGQSGAFSSVGWSSSVGRGRPFAHHRLSLGEVGRQGLYQRIVTAIITTTTTAAA
jgi:hypothetical protein